jgi:hypothetical protein
MHIYPTAAGKLQDRREHLARRDESVGDQDATLATAMRYHPEFPFRGY